ncbi:hypothetical protein T12_9264 [Trichinella patagoniensis]|uniref:Uncharacterized protein n=1 Tax=Trichinella patagoniensis TaxID=990121 RepID=A0A0V0ZHN3_9BILA|nr:hypothetical protein T12_9264 [Trichinella patagoniensis]
MNFLCKVLFVCTVVDRTENGIVAFDCAVSASLNSSASLFPQTPPPLCDSLYSDRLHTIDRRAFNKMSCNI